MRVWVNEWLSEWYHYNDIILHNKKIYFCPSPTLHCHSDWDTIWWLLSDGVSTMIPYQAGSCLHHGHWATLRETETGGWTVMSLTSLCVCVCVCVWCVCVCVFAFCYSWERGSSGGCWESPSLPNPLDCIFLCCIPSPCVLISFSFSCLFLIFFLLSLSLTEGLVVMVGWYSHIDPLDLDVRLYCPFAGHRGRRSS